MLSCKDITELCTDFEEGALTTVQWAQFKMHLLMCPPCMEYVQQMRLTAESLKALRGAEDVPEEARSELSRLFQDWRQTPDDE